MKEHAMPQTRLMTCITALLFLTACALKTPPVSVSAPPPAPWPAPAPKPVARLPHSGTLTELTRYWTAQGDPLLVDLISAAEAVSPSVSSAQARIEQARAHRTVADAGRLPSLSASAGISHGRGPVLGFGVAPRFTAVQAGLQTTWEIDLFGGQRARREAAHLRYEGAQSQWHDARVLMAAEVAQIYYNLRTCEKLMDVAQADAASRAETARLVALSAEAGFTAPETASLAKASSAEGNSRATQQGALCELEIKALVALTALQDTALKEKLAAAQRGSTQTIGPTGTIPIENVSAQALAQRPDLLHAEREVAAARADIGSAQADRHPRLGLNGSISENAIHSEGISSDFNAGALGTLTVSLPLFDGGRRAAEVNAARARYDDAVSQYHTQVRQAVREVEAARVNLKNIEARREDVSVAAEGYRAAFAGTEARYKTGLGNLLEMEEARRTKLASEIALFSLQQERASAWVALYRAMGGGWTAFPPSIPP